MSAQLDQTLGEYSEALDNAVSAAHGLVADLGYEAGVVALYNSLREDLNDIQITAVLAVAAARLASHAGTTDSQN